VKNGLLGNPQYRVARAPGQELIVRGAISHELVSTRFRALGTERAERAVALTFDDGPSIYTPRIVAVLRRLHVPATFFTIGFQVDIYPQYVALEREAGMVTGNHTYNHPDVPPFAQLPRRLVVDEIALGAESLQRAGVRPHLFRPPGGSVSEAVVRDAQSLGERIVLWSVDPGDWRKGVSAKQIKAAVLGAVKPGSIVILHDGGGDRTATVRALPLIVRGIRHRGLRLVALAPSGRRQQ
jgi:peptidoglycan-N-acetylglucosamine deacetylase